MMRHLFLFSFLLLAPLAKAGIGNATTISGHIVDGDNKPLELVVITLLKAEDSTLVKGAFSASDGTFTLEGIPAGKFFVTASLTGYEKKWIGPVEVSDGQELKLQDISLTASKELSEVAIVSKQPLFVQKPGMLVMNVENSPVRISGTAYDVISKAPGVVVDQDGNFTLQGKPGVKIYMDGKPTYLSGEQLRDYLQAIPASEVVRVELMTTPPAKYDAEGSAGIINVVTRKGMQQGLNGSVSGGAGYGMSVKEEAGFSLNYGQPKFNIYSRYDFNEPQRKEKKFVTRTVPYMGHTTRYDQDVDLLINPLSHHARVGVDFTPSKKITYGLRLDGSALGINALIDTRNTVTQVDSGTSQILHQINSRHADFQSGSVSAYYEQHLDTSGTEISASFDYLRYSNRSHENYDLHFLDNSGVEMTPPMFERSITGTGIDIYVGQIDFTHPFLKKYKLETGIKSSYVSTSNDLLFQAEDANGSWQKDTTKSNSFLYKEQINAAYVTCSADYGKWQIQAGLRAEQTISDGNSPTTGQDHRNNYIQLFPTLFVTQKINDKQSMQYSLSRRINRPSYEELNPFVFYIDQYTYHVGNPFLQPEIANSAEITHDYGDFLFTTLGVSRTTGGIAQVTHQIDSTGILNQSSVNLNTIDNGYLSVTLSIPFTKWWINEANVLLNYNRYKTELYGVPVDRGNLVFNGSLTETFLLPKGWKVELSGWYQSPMQYSIFLIEPSGDVSLGVSKNFLKNKLRFSLNASDLFYTQTQHAKVDFDTQHLYAIHEFDTRVVYVRLRYNFGNSNAARKSQFKSGADDLKNRVGK